MISQPGVDRISRQPFFSRQAVDPRADGAIRTVRVDAAGVTIERALRGVRMKVAVPVASYRGLFLAVRATSGTATLTLRHADADLDVVLGGGEAVALARAAKAWGELLKQPIAIEDACVRMRPSLPRRAKRPMFARRCGFARRRKLGVEARMATSFAHEHEIIARS